MRNPSKYLLAAAVVTSILVAAPLAMGAGEGRPMDGGARNPSSDASQNYTRETQIIANVQTYGTRQSNKSNAGGGAIYGCRATVPSTNTCVRASNLSNGQAFSFSTQGGPTVGRIESTNRAAAPFTTNANGVATGLNADKVDGKEAAEFAAATDVTALSASLLAAQVAQDGSLGANGRGAVASAVNGNVYTVKFNRDVSKCSFTASPVGSPGPGAPGVAATPNAADSVNVELTAPGSFHLQVIC
jgi:hypothetical protein